MDGPTKEGIPQGFEPRTVGALRQCESDETFSILTEDARETKPEGGIVIGCW